jgi:HSP20 family molecular chaperone IbpA
VKSEDVSIEVNEQVLTISGSRVPVETGEAQLVETLHIPKPAEIKPKKIAIGAGSQKQLEK